MINKNWNFLTIIKNDRYHQKENLKMRMEMKMKRIFRINYSMEIDNK